MLRMAHRIAVQGVRTTPEFADIGSTIQNSIAGGATVLVADNCAREIFDSELQCDRFMNPCDLPCIKPPFAEMLVEYEVPESYRALAAAEHKGNAELLGSLQETTTHGAMVASIEQSVISRIVCAASNRPDIRATQQYKTFEDMHSLGGVTVLTISVLAVCRGQVALAPVNYHVALDNTGALIPGSMTSRTNELTEGQCSELLSHNLGPVFFSLAMCHCRNVEQLDVTAEYSPPEKWCRRQKCPEIRYRVLKIDEAKKTLKATGRSETEGLARALHICRGHFATYTADKPLFGSIVGTVWKPAHVRGDIKQGAVVKDYSVSPQ